MIKGLLLIKLWISLVIRNILLFTTLFINSFNNAYSDEAKDEEPIDKRPEVSQSRKDIDDSKIVISEIMSDKPFVFIKEEKIWNFETDQKQDPELNPDMAWLTGLVSFFTMLIEAVLWVVPLIVVFYLYKYRDYWLNLIQGNSLKKDSTDLPQTLFGLDIRHESLPENIEKAASLLWQESHHREAVSLLYRGALAALFKQYRFDLPAGATEHDCIRQLESSSAKVKVSTNEKTQSDISQRTDQFKKLTDVWVSVAYAHRLPDKVVFDEVCNNWNHYFSEDGVHE